MSRFERDVAQRFAAHGASYDSNFFQKLVELQKRVGSLTKECEELKEDGRRRQESYVRRETQLRQTIESLEDRLQSMSTDLEQDDASTILRCREQLGEGIAALLERQKITTGRSQLDRLEQFDAKLRELQNAFQQKSTPRGSSAPASESAHRHAVELMEDLAHLRKSHAALQTKYGEERQKSAQLKTECTCLKDTERLLAKQLVELRQQLRESRNGAD